VPDIEVKIVDFVGSTGRDDLKPQPEGKPNFEVGARLLPRVIGHDEARVSDFSHDLIGDATDVFLRINPHGLKSRCTNARIKTVHPHVSHALGEVHGDERSCRDAS
jgi:hypothetical protein